MGIILYGENPNVTSTPRRSIPYSYLQAHISQARQNSPNHFDIGQTQSP